MAFVTKTWKDRLVEYAGRRKLKNVSTGEEVLMDVSRSEGTVSQAGDAFNATNMNDLEQRIKTEFDSVNSSLGGLSFAQDADGNWGYKVGADSVVPFSTKCPYIVNSVITVSHITGAGDYVRVLNGNVTFAPNGCKTFTISRMKLGNTYFLISDITNGTYTLSDDNTAYIITPIDNTLDVVTKWSEIRSGGQLTMCFIKSYT